MSIFENLFVSLNGEESRILTIKKIPKEAKSTPNGESQIEHIVHIERKYEFNMPKRNSIFWSRGTNTCSMRPEVDE